MAALRIASHIRTRDRSARVLELTGHRLRRRRLKIPPLSQRRARVNLSVSKQHAQITKAHVASTVRRRGADKTVPWSVA